MPTLPLYPLRFEPIFQYRLWGGRKLEKLSRTHLPGDEPIGEAWILSDRDDYASVVANGDLAGVALTQLLANHPKEMLGAQEGKFTRFPLLLKFLDAAEMLSVQVHPSDAHKDLLPAGERGKTEAWLVLEADAESSIYAGLNPGATPESMREKSSNGTVEDDLASFHPVVGDGVFIPAGTVHALGGGVVVFEVQQNSDVTYRLYDWNRVDSKTGKSRDLHIEQAIACTNFQQGPVGPITPGLISDNPVRREELFRCEFFITERIQGSVPFLVGTPNEMRVIVCAEGCGKLGTEEVKAGDVWVLPAIIGTCPFEPNGKVTILEIAVAL